MTPGRSERIIIGLFIPPLLGGFFCACALVVDKLVRYFNFSWVRISDSIETIFSLIPVSISLMFFSLFFYGIQSLIYSLLMEFVVQRINNDKLVIFISMLLGVFVVRFLGIGNISGIDVDPVTANFVILVAGIVGLIVGYYLRKKFNLKTS